PACRSAHYSYALVMPIRSTVPAAPRPPRVCGRHRHPLRSKPRPMTADPRALEALARRLGPERARRDVPLAPLTTFRIGGPADLYFRACSADALADAVQAARELDVPYFLLGAGANVLVGDRGFRGLVIRSDVGGVELL